MSFGRAITYFTSAFASCRIASSVGESGVDTCKMSTKAIKDIMPAPRAHWVGNGFHVYPVFSNLAFSAQISPFLMFDYAAPERFEPTSQKKGVGRHPHRGFETVTIAWQGEVEHADSVGNSGVIGPGDVQWMTAGRGIVHQEYHSTNFARQGGMLEMCQLWVNLPKAYKMSPPKYQAIQNQQIPVAPLSEDDEALAHGSVRVIAGEYRGVTGPAKTFTPINVWDVQMKTHGRAINIDVAAGHNTLIFVRGGKVKVGSEGLVGPQGMVRLEQAGTLIQLEAVEPNTQLLLLGGEPINEPIAKQGPFCMNTAAEVKQAFEDYQSGRLGQ